MTVGLLGLFSSRNAAAATIRVITLPLPPVWDDKVDDWSHIPASQVLLHKPRLAAEQASRTKSELPAIMSHEIRRQINIVLGMTAVLLRTNLNDKQRRFAESAQRKGLELAYSIPPQPHPWLRGNSGRLRQILTNLVGNGIKFNDRGEVGAA